MNSYQIELKTIMRRSVKLAYRVTKDFPKSEMYGIVSQLRRATLSILLNYVEGYARRKPLVRLNFLETSYGSQQETKEIVGICLDESLLKINDKDVEELIRLVDRIGAMLWREITNLDNVN